MPKIQLPAGDLDNLARETQAQVGLDRYVPPVLAGRGAGAALAYAALAQAPARAALLAGTVPGVASGRSNDRRLPPISPPKPIVPGVFAVKVSCSPRPVLGHQVTHRGKTSELPG